VQRLQLDASHLQWRAFDDANVRARQGIDRRSRDPALHALLQVTLRRDVIGVDMGVQGHRQGQAQARDLLEVAVDRIDNRIDEQRAASSLASEQVGVGTGASRRRHAFSNRQARSGLTRRERSRIWCAE